MLIDMLNFLLENDVVIKSMNNQRCLSADEAFELGGEYIVYIPGNRYDLYRGDSFENALKVLNGED